MRPCPGAPSSKPRCGGEPCFSGTTRHRLTLLRFRMSMKTAGPIFRTCILVKVSAPRPPQEHVARTSCHQPAEQANPMAAVIGLMTARPRDSLLFILLDTTEQKALRAPGCYPGVLARPSTTNVALCMTGRWWLLHEAVCSSAAGTKGPCQYGGTCTCLRLHPDLNAVVVTEQRSSSSNTKSLSLVGVEAKVVDVNFFCEYTRRTIKLWRPERHRRPCPARRDDTRCPTLHEENVPTASVNPAPTAAVSEIDRGGRAKSPRRRVGLLPSRRASCWSRNSKCLEQRYASRTLCQLVAEDGSVGVVYAVKRPPSHAI